MNIAMPNDQCSSLIDRERRIGTITKVTASIVELNLPRALVVAGRRNAAQGTVGDFVFIDCDFVVLLGRIIEVHIPEKNRSLLESQTRDEVEVDPVGKVQLLATIDKTTQSVSRGLAITPKIGDGVFVTSGSALSRSIESALFSGIEIADTGKPLGITLGRIASVDNTDISIPPESLFGRHCGVFGATGGGKSWTLARLIAGIESMNGKAVVIDPTGEFSGTIKNAVECSFSKCEANQELVHFPYEKITERSLFSLFRPSAQGQAPTLREAIRSLRLIRMLTTDSHLVHTNAGNFVQHTDPANPSIQFIATSQGGNLYKANGKIAPFKAALERYRDRMSDPHCDFDIFSLKEQVENECVYATGFKGDSTFGGRDERMLGYCNTLVLRIGEMLASSELNCMFRKDGKNFCKLLTDFLTNRNQRVCLVSFKHVSFNYNARELLLNTIGDYLLGLARNNQFMDQPIVCFLDEAHQFMGRSVGDEINRVSLDAFGLIAKEGRKYGLTSVLATQRPGDIPQDVLSQLGTLFIHRLTNERDREMVERACGELSRSAATFIPSLSQGEALLVGPDLPIPLPIQILAPSKESQPKSYGPNYQKCWSGTC